MNEFFAFFDQNKVDGGMVIFLMFFSLGIALFQTIMLSGLYNLKFPTWLFFVLCPSFIGLSFLVDSKYTLMVFFFLFASVFILGIIGMFYSGIRSSKTDKEEREKFNRKHKIKETTLGKKLLGLLMMIGVIGGFYGLVYIEKLHFLFFIIPGLIFIKFIFFPSNKSKFLKLQAVLPTSKMNAIAMGLVEVEGDLEEIEPIISPYFSKPCIGYYYTIEEEGPADDDGKRSYRTIFTELKVGDFKIKDETGSVAVNGEGLEFYFDRIDKQEGGKKRYSETYLKHNDYILLIGYADSDQGNTVLRKGDSNGVFGVAIPQSISFRNKYQPLLVSFLTTLFFITFILIYIILN
ncbi:hypothetical protein [Flavobacterium sp. 140616W15]|uniref:hypothetical protein n=1 Tax=Flavobacterium sp. 140616W15 TaxID=2478552 RepID=UPI000F0C61B1|nr:hypothetical protein [Flavobacterium sp. 140616W15]AYN05643.1 hypothetical protein EAG11_16910 [Flavobacterium sp. 140616W15]